MKDLEVDVPGGWPRVLRAVSEANGSASFEPGDEFDLFGQAPDGLNLYRSEKVVLADVDKISISLIGDPEGASIYDVSELTPGEWLRWDGSVSTEPCPAI